MALGPIGIVTGERATTLGKKWPPCLLWLVADWGGSSAGVLAPLFPYTLYLPNSPILVAAVPVFCLHRECNFSWRALASKVPPSLFPPASSVACSLSQLLHDVQPYIYLRQHWTLLVLCVGVCRETARLFVLFGNGEWKGRRGDWGYGRTGKERAGFLGWVFWCLFFFFFPGESVQSSQIRRITTILKWLSRSVFLLTASLPDPSVLQLLLL